jgi:hypothetical protein
MTSDDCITLTAELGSVLNRLIGLQSELHGAIDEQLDAMRRSDAGDMMAAAQCEGRLCSRISALDERRREIVAALCECTGLVAPAGVQHVSLRMLAVGLDESQRTELLEAGQALREKMLQVAEANRVVELVSREMLAHFRDLFAAFTQDDDSRPTYSRGGSLEAGKGVKVLDAVG